MKEIKYYKIDNKYQNTTIILPLSKILLDNGMRLKVSELCPSKAKDFKLKIIKNDKSLPLNNDKLTTIQENTILEPIKVKQFKLTSYYEVIDGRHRYIYSLNNNYDHIPVIII
tara:strand:- start:684 stop:1022 length:339 start_codon:yes stop_codon:yes gene_type:complete